jgi:hypothetical protein
MSEECRGCPNTEMVSHAASFEEENPGLDFHRNFQAPHYSSRATRIAYYNWTLKYPGLYS